jgi:hydrogenase maturation factor HypF (carbamoyltransferase family)
MTTIDRTLIVSDTLPGFVRTHQAEDLERYGAVLEARGAHHLGHTLRLIAEALLAGHAVTLTTNRPTTEGTEA